MITSVTTGSRAKLPSHVGDGSQKMKERSSRLQEEEPISL